jgi:hypothetical protein
VLLSVASLAAQKPVSLQDPADSVAASDIVGRYLRFPFGKRIHPDSIADYAVDEFGKQLTARKGELLAFPQDMTYRITGVQSIRPGDTLATVTVVAVGDTIPRFGPMVIDWVFFVRKVEHQGWRISAVRRQVGIEDVADRLRQLDTSTAFPTSLKGTIAVEWGTQMLSNEQLRRNFMQNRDQFGALLEQFHRHDSMRMVSRFDRQISQVNYTVVYWDPAAQEVPQAAIDEYMSTASKQERKNMKAMLRHAENLRRAGRDSVAVVARKFGLDPARLDTVAAAMKDLRISFVNSNLPWEGAVQFTVDGTFDNVGGYLYSPEGIPWISPDEYYYLEDLGNGWWLFRAT